MKALSTRNDDPTTASRPWDRDRDGFVMGEGAGVMVLEEYVHARKRGARIYAELVGFGMSADAYHMTAPDMDGPRRCMLAALASAAVNADEVTYPAHVLLRSEIEPALIAGEIRVGDIPAWWDERMGRLLDVDTRGDFAGGPLQDIHWSQGMFGYFPSYLIGAMIAAQLNAAYRAATPDHDARETSGDFSGYPVWLDRNIWSAGAQHTTGELVVRATGKPLSADALKAHFEKRYL
jgi:hypothetical protein